MAQSVRQKKSAIAPASACAAFVALSLVQVSHAAPAEALYACTTIKADNARLACFDQAMTPSDAEGSTTIAPPAPSPAGYTPTASRASSEDLVQPSIGITAAAQTSGPDFRIDAGYQWSVGDHAGRFHVLKGSLNFDSGLGSSGGGPITEGWIDNWPFEDLTIGLEYLHIQNQGKILAVLPRGLSVLTDPVIASVSVQVGADLGMLNFAWRPREDSILQPVVGVGVGAGHGEAADQTLLSNVVFGKNADSNKANSIVGGFQGFAGVDLNLGNSAYLSLIPRVLWASGHPWGRDQRYLDYSIGSAIGVYF